MFLTAMDARMLVVLWFGVPLSHFTGLCVSALTECGLQPPHRRLWMGPQTSVHKFGNVANSTVSPLCCFEEGDLG